MIWELYDVLEIGDTAGIPNVYAQNARLVVPGRAEILGVESKSIHPY